MIASRAAWSAFNESNLVPMDAQNWDTYASRLNRYPYYESYYHNTVYTDLAQASIQHKKNARLYKFIRGIYNPSARLVDLYVSKVYGGSLDFENCTVGAIPITQADEQLRAAISQLWRWSNWGNNKSLYVRYGAMLGDTVLKIVDEREKQKVRMEVLHPNKIADMTLDASGNVKRVVIQYEKIDDQPNTGNAWLNSTVLNRPYTYTEIITTDKFETYRDGELFAYYADASGEPVKEWPNEYGFVPVVLCKHKDMGLQWGANAFHADLDKIDTINDQASILNSQVRKAVQLVWLFSGAQKSDELQAGSDDPDKIPALYAKEGVTATPLIANLNIADASANIQHLLAELERDMPELSLHRLREMGNLTAPGVRAGYSDAIDRITEARGNYDGALIRAQQMAVTIGAIGGYRNFEPFDESSYDAGDLEHSIAERPVIADALSTMERITALQSIGGTERLILQALDVDEDSIDLILAEKERRTREAARGFSEGVFGVETDEPDEIEPPDEMPILPAMIESAADG